MIITTEALIIKQKSIQSKENKSWQDHHFHIPDTVIPQAADLPAVHQEVPIPFQEALIIPTVTHTATTEM